MARRAPTQRELAAQAARAERVEGKFRSKYAYKEAKGRLDEGQRQQYEAELQRIEGDRSARVAAAGGESQYQALLSQAPRNYNENRLQEYYGPGGARQYFGYDKPEPKTVTYADGMQVTVVTPEQRAYEESRALYEQRQASRAGNARYVTQSVRQPVAGGPAPYARERMVSLPRAPTGVYAGRGDSITGYEQVIVTEGSRPRNAAEFFERLRGAEVYAPPGSRQPRGSAITVSTPRRRTTTVVTLRGERTRTTTSLMTADTYANLRAERGETLPLSPTPTWQQAAFALAQNDIARTAERLAGREGGVQRLQQKTGQGLIDRSRYQSPVFRRAQQILGASLLDTRPQEHLTFTEKLSRPFAQAAASSTSSLVVRGPLLSAEKGLFAFKLKGYESLGLITRGDVRGVTSRGEPFVIPAQAPALLEQRTAGRRALREQFTTTEGIVQTGIVVAPILGYQIKTFRQQPLRTRAPESYRVTATSTLQAERTSGGVPRTKAPAVLDVTQQGRPNPILLTESSPDLVGSAVRTRYTFTSDQPLIGTFNRALGRTARVRQTITPEGAYLETRTANLLGRQTRVRTSIPQGASEATMLVQFGKRPPRTFTVPLGPYLTSDLSFGRGRERTLKTEKVDRPQTILDVRTGVPARLGVGRVARGRYRAIYQVGDQLYMGTISRRRGGVFTAEAGPATGVMRMTVRDALGKEVFGRSRKVPLRTRLLFGEEQAPVSTRNVQRLTDDLNPGTLLAETYTLEVRKPEVRASTFLRSRFTGTLKRADVIARELAGPQRLPGMAYGRRGEYGSGRAPREQQVFAQNFEARLRSIQKEIVETRAAPFMEDLSFGRLPRVRSLAYPRAALFASPLVQSSLRPSYASIEAPVLERQQRSVVQPVKVAEFASLAQSRSPAIIEMTRTRQRQETRLLTQTLVPTGFGGGFPFESGPGVPRTPTPPPPPIIPFEIPLWGRPEGGFPGTRTGRRAFKYVPDLSAGVFQVRGRKPRGALTGLEVRPILEPTRRRAKRKAKR